jgi:hypothetical protein
LKYLVEVTYSCPFQFVQEDPTVEGLNTYIIAADYNGPPSTFVWAIIDLIMIADRMIGSASDMARNRRRTGTSH